MFFKYLFIGEISQDYKEYPLPERERVIYTVHGVDRVRVIRFSAFPSTKTPRWMPSRQGFGT
jgi:hypothetical protein